MSEEYHNPKLSGPYEHVHDGAACLMVLAVMFLLLIAGCVVLGAAAAVAWSFWLTLRFVEFKGEHLIHWPNLAAVVLVFWGLVWAVRKIRQHTP